MNAYGTALDPDQIAAVEAPRGDLPPSPAFVCPIPPSTFLMSLTGFDEIAIANHFGAQIGSLREDPITAGRALAFVHERREGSTDPDAYKASMMLTMQAVVDYFAPEPKTDETPASAEGKAP